MFVSGQNIGSDNKKDSKDQDDNSLPVAIFMVCMVIVMIIIQQFIAAPIANFQALESLYQDQDVSSILSAISIPSTSIFLESWPFYTP